jgi:L-lysine exporter family protein LysE/ArgO
MIEAIASGATSGFVLSLMLGTVFFALIQNSIDYGFTTGIYIAAGVVVSDVLFISAALFGTSLVPAIEENQNTIRVAGSIVLLVMGVAAWKPKNYSVTNTSSKTGSAFYFLSKGFFLNALNPVNFFAWVSIATYLKGAMQYTLQLQVTYFTACLGAIFITECGISFGASKLRRWMNASSILWINRLAGTVFIVMAIVLLWPLLLTDRIKNYLAFLNR